MFTAGQGFSSADGSLLEMESRCDRILEPKRVIYFNGEQATFDRKTLEREIEAFGAKNDQLYMISISGLCRSGKSFLINLMIHYLDFYCQHGTDDGWERSPHPITGVKWARGQKQSVTQGMWMLLYPNLVHGKRLLFMDCQGTGDNDQYTPTLDKMIMFYALKLSDLTIINIRGKIEPRDLDALGVCLLTKQGKQLPTDFKDLSFLIRDWPDDDQPMPLAEMAETTKSPDVKQSVRSILKSCRTVQSTGLPHPGKRVCKASETDGLTLEEVDEPFVAACKEYFKKVLIEEPSKSTTTKRGRQFVLDFKLLGDVMVEKSTSLMDACVTSIMNDAYTDALNLLEARGVGILGNHFNTEQEMRRAADEALKEAVKKYQTDPRILEYADEEKQREIPDGLKEIAEDYVKKGAQKIREREREKQLSEAKEAAAKSEREMQKMKAELEEERERRAQLEEQKKQKQRDEDFEKEELRRQNAERDRKIAELAQLQKDKDQAEKKKQNLLNEKDDDTEVEAQHEMTVGEKFVDGWTYLGEGLVAATGGAAQVASVTKDVLVDTTKFAATAVADVSSAAAGAVRDNCSIS